MNRFQALVKLARRDFVPLNYAARPYLEALETLEGPAESFYSDSGVSCVRYFLANATSWRGPVARYVKAELKLCIGDKVTIKGLTYAASDWPGSDYLPEDVKGWLAVRAPSKPAPSKARVGGTIGTLDNF